MVELDAKQLRLREIYEKQFVVQERKQVDEAEGEMRRCGAALAADGTNPDRYLDLAACYRASSRFDEAMDLLQEGVRTCPPSSRLYHAWIDLLEDSNRTRDAIDKAREAGSRFPDELGFKLRERLILPILYDTPEEIDFHRKRYSAGLQALIEEVDLSSEADRRSALGAINRFVNFQLGYQGRDDLEIQRQYGGLVQRIMAANYPQWTVARRMPPLRTGGKVRIGYVSGHFRNNVVSKVFMQWLCRYDREKFEVYAYSVGKRSDSVTEEIRRSVTSFRYYPDDLEGVCQAILADDLHVLVFLSIGTKPLMTQLAALRLVPLQCMTWGHPITSGMDTVEYFLSNELMEPECAAEHYSEALVRLPGIGCCYQKPVIPSVLLTKSREDFGLRKEDAVFLCCQSLFKYLPQDDDLFPRIAQRVPRARFVFLERECRAGRDFRKRLERAFRHAGLNSDDHCILLRFQDICAYWSLCRISDVFLDSLEFSGCNTTMDAIASKLPVVTLPGKLMRGRQSAAILSQLGVPETIARDKAEYVVLAVRLALDPEWRRQIVDRMVAGYAGLFMDLRSVRAVEDFYKREVEARLRASRGIGGWAAHKPLSDARLSTPNVCGG